MGALVIRRVVGVVTLGLAVLAFVPVPGTGAQAPAATVDSEGWWNAAPAEAPETPLPLPPVGVAPVPQTPTPDVPEGAIAVGARLGRPARVAALGIVLDAERGSTVTSFLLRLQEAEGTFAQQGSDPAVRACPVTSFLVPEQGGAPTNIPDADCEIASSDGTRNDDGTWSFDLTAIASAWLDPFGSVQANGIRLDPVGEPPATFQVAFTGMEDAVITADITSPAEAGDPFASGGGGGGFDAPVSGGSDFSSPPAELPPVDTPVETPVEAPAEGGAEEQAAPVAVSRAGETFGNWPLAVLLLALGALLLATAVSLALGPTGRKRPELARRQGGVSRALGAHTAPSTRA